MTTEAYRNPDKGLLYRYSKTVDFIDKIGLSKKMSILDLGEKNPFSDILSEKGFTVLNSGKIDLDLNPESFRKYDVQTITAFEIFEHLVSPFPLLQNLPGEKLIATVPLRLWFKSAYKNARDPWDCHYHEFEDWQFDWLLKKSGWNIILSEKWIIPSRSFGIRPILRNITPRIYAVYAVRNN